MAGITKYVYYFFSILQFEKEIAKPKSIKSYFFKPPPFKSDTFFFLSRTLKLYATIFKCDNKDEL